LTGENPSVTVRAKNAKNRKESVLPLPADLAADLRTHFGLALPGASAFPGAWKDKGGAMLAVDLEAAKIAAVDDTGCVVDFHALRHTFATLGAKAGIPLAVMQKLMRHSDPKLTANVYSHIRLVDEAVELTKLPALIPATGWEKEAARSTGTYDEIIAEMGWV
jgi:integrase